MTTDGAADGAADLVDPVGGQLATPALRHVADGRTIGQVVLEVSAP